jgi:hypothetical protein
MLAASNVSSSSIHMPIVFLDVALMTPTDPSPYQVPTESTIVFLFERGWSEACRRFWQVAGFRSQQNSLIDGCNNAFFHRDGHRHFTKTISQIGIDLVFTNELVF